MHKIKILSILLCTSLLFGLFPVNLMADTITADEIFIPSGGYIQFTDESRGHLLALDYDGKTVTKFDIFSGETLESKEFLNKIKKIKFYDNGYYFVFSNSDSIYVYDEYFELKDTINVGRSFFDFEFGHDGYLYFICEEEAFSFDMENEEIIDVIKTESFGNLVKHPDGGFFYFADSDKNVKLYSYDGGKIFIGDTFLDGEIFKAHNLKISSNYLFTTSGVYKISQNPQNLKLHFSFGFPCNVLIDGQNSRFFGVDDSFITEYDINSFEIVRGISVGYLYNTESYFINGKIVLMEFYNDEITIRIINPDLSPEINYEKEKVSLWNYPDRISWDGEMYFSDNFYLKEEDVIYILSNDLCKIDLKQNEMIKVKVPYSCHKLYFENNKLYLPCSGNDIILVFDKDLTRIDTLFPGIDFFDISFGNDGYLYLAYEYGIFSYDLGKNEVYKKTGLGFEFTEIIKDPKSNVFYLHDDYYSAPLTKITYDNGEIIDIHSFGNMYHGIHYFLDGRIIDYYGNLYELGNNTLSFLSGPPFYSRTSYIENNSLYTLYDEFIYEYDLDTFKLKSIMEISYGYYNEGEVDLYKKMAMLCYYALTG